MVKGKARDGAVKTPKVRKIREPKKKTTAAEALAAAGTTPSTEHKRVTTFKANGGSSAAVPSAEVSTGLGPVELPSPEDSVKVLAKLADLNDKAIVKGKRWEESKETAKRHKDDYDKAMEAVSTYLSQATHKSDLPLFADVDRREQDQKQMEAGNLIKPDAQSDAAQNATETAPEGSGEAIDPANDVQVATEFKTCETCAGLGHAPENPDVPCLNCGATGYLAELPAETAPAPSEVIPTEPVTEIPDSEVPF